jgi:hypothetical protein
MEDRGPSIFERSAPAAPAPSRPARDLYAPSRAAEETAVFTPVRSEEPDDIEAAAGAVAAVRAGMKQAEAARAQEPFVVPDEDDWGDEPIFPIEDYDLLRVAEILPLLRELDPDELEEVRDREEAGRARATILTRIDQLLGHDDTLGGLAGPVLGPPPAPLPAPEPPPVPSPPPAPPAEPVVAASSASVFPIADYDELRVAQILPLLSELDPDELEEVAAWESQRANRRSVLSRIDRLLQGSSTAASGGPPRAAAAKSTAAKRAATKSTGARTSPTKAPGANKAATTKAASAKSGAPRSPATKSAAAKAAGRTAKAPRAAQAPEPSTGEPTEQVTVNGPSRAGPSTAETGGTPHRGPADEASGLPWGLGDETEAERFDR